MKYSERTLNEDQMLKTALYFLSLVNAAFGLFLIGAYFFYPGGGIPVVAGLTGLALLIQGIYTMVYITGSLERWHERAAQLFVSGETASILAGGLAAVQGFLYNLHPRNGDYEFLPMGLGVFMAVQAIVGLVYASGASSRHSARAIH
jgi:hypothetical protein